MARQQQQEHTRHVDGAAAYRDHVVDEDPATADLGARQQGKQETDRAQHGAEHSETRIETDPQHRPAQPGHGPGGSHGTASAAGEQHRPPDGLAECGMRAPGKTGVGIVQPQYTHDAEDRRNGDG